MWDRREKKTKRIEFQTAPESLHTYLDSHCTAADHRSFFPAKRWELPEGIAGRPLRPLHQDEEVFVARADGSRPRHTGTGTALGWDPAGQNRFAWWRFELREDSFGFEDRVPVVYFGQPGNDEITEFVLGYLDWDVLGWWAPGSPT